MKIKVFDDEKFKRKFHKKFSLCLHTKSDDLKQLHKKIKQKKYIAVLKKKEEEEK